MEKNASMEVPVIVSEILSFLGVVFLPLISYKVFALDWLSNSLLCVGAVLWFWLVAKLYDIRELAENGEYAAKQAQHWQNRYFELAKHCESIEESLNTLDNDFFDLQQAHSELGAAYNDLHDLLVENGIDPDIPRL